MSVKGLKPNYSSSEYMQPVTKTGFIPVAYLEGPLRLPPFQLTIIFYDGIFGRFTHLFSSRTSKFRHSLTKKRQLRPPDPLPGLCPWTPLGDFRPPDPLGLSFRTF